MTTDILLPSLWDDAHAATLDEPGLLLYRSNLLGSDLRITNFGGGNTSAKVAAKDPLTGADVQVLWVKGSGGDIGSMKLDGFATVYMDRLYQLRAQYRDLSQEDAMVEALSRLAADSALRDKLREAGHAQVAKFSWDRTAAMTYDVYKSVM